MHFHPENSGPPEVLTIFPASEFPCMMKEVICEKKVNERLGPQLTTSAAMVFFPA